MLILPRPGCPGLTCFSTERRNVGKAKIREASSSCSATPGGKGACYGSWGCQVSTGESRGGRDRRGSSPGHEDGRVDSVGGRGEGRVVGAQFDIFSFFFLLFFKGDPYPEFGAQRADEGDGFPVI